MTKITHTKVIQNISYNTLPHGRQIIMRAAVLCECLQYCVSAFYPSCIYSEFKKCVDYNTVGREAGLEYKNTDCSNDPTRCIVDHMQV